MKLTPQVEGLLECRNAYLEAPAGYGKTYTIGQAAGLASQRGKVLILTHTHAGVASIRAHLTPRTNCDVSTISSFMLHLVGAYPYLCDFDISDPLWESRYVDIRDAFVRLVGLAQIRDIIECSFSAVLVDEYQDCDARQHAAIMVIGECVPTKVVGDPLQGIFGFPGTQLVDLCADIPPQYERLPDLDRPMRWELADNGALGEWLGYARSILKDGGALTLEHSPVRLYWKTDGDARLSALCEHRQRDKERCAAIINVEEQCYSLARRCAGKFRVMEEIECKRLMELATVFDGADREQHVIALYDLVSRCRVRLTRFVSRSQMQSAIRGRLKRKDLNPTQSLVRSYLASGDIDVLATLFHQLSEEGTKTDACELLSEARRMFRNVVSGAGITWRAAALAVRRATSEVGRRAEAMCITRTWLVKGLDFDHVIVLEPGKLDSKNLYVAITRGAKSLTVVTECSIIQPAKKTGERALRKRKSDGCDAKGQETFSFASVA